jgi:transposase-like protein
MFNDQEKHEGGITTMAQVNLTLNQEEILQLLSSGDSSSAFKELLTKSLNQFLAAESASQLKAEPYERSEERQDQRNGIRERPLTTRIGTITLQVPRHRNQPFHTQPAFSACLSTAALRSVSMSHRARRK